MEKIVRIEPFLLEPGQEFANGYEKYSKVAMVPGVKTGITRGKQPISEEDEKQLEQDLALAPGTLSPRSDFWKTYVVRLGDRGETLYLNDPWDRLKLALLKVVDEVAPTLHSKYDPSTGGKYQQARYYISDPEAEAKARNSKFELEDRSIQEFGKLTGDMKKRISRLLGCLPSAKASDEVIHSSLRSFIGQSDGNKMKFLDMLSRRKEEIIVEDELREAKELGLIKVLKGGKVVRVYGDGAEEDIAPRFEEAISFYLNIKNADLRDELRNDMKKAKEEQ